MNGGRRVRRNITRERLGILGVMTGATVIFTIVYLVTGVIFRAIPHPPSPLGIQIINTVLGFVVCFITLTIIGRLFGSKQRALRMGVFNPIIEAMARIAEGDFSVQLDDNLEGDEGIVNELAKSVNTMALELNQMEQMR